MKTNKCGFLLFAFGNKELDYGKLAVCCALSIKTNLKQNHTSVVVDESTKNWLNRTISKEVLYAAFDNIILSNEKFRSSKRKHFDSPWSSFQAEFNNQNRVLSYDYSPYDETIVLDSDYLVMNDHFDHIWGNSNDFLMNCSVVDLQNKPLGTIYDQRISKYGVPLYWATSVYFRKSKFAKMFFDLVNYISEEYSFYQFLYGFPKTFYRNDFSFSIAAHMLSGFVTGGIRTFPESVIYTSPQKDGIAKLIDSKEIIFLSHSQDEEWKSILVNIKGINVHVMNKRELIRISDDFIQSCMEKL